MKQRVTLTIGLALGLVLLAIAFRPGAQEPGPTPTPEPEPARSIALDAPAKTTPRKPPTEPLRVPEPAFIPEQASAVVGALDALPLPDAFRLRCAAELGDGLYEALPGPEAKPVRFITVREGELFAAAWADSGDVWVVQELQRVAKLRWNDAGAGWSSCSVEPVEFVDVSGTVHFGTDGPAVHSVVGCRAGDPADVGQDGAFMLQLALGTDCHLTVVAEQGDQIGRGPSVPIRVIGPTNGVDLHGPRSEELWSPERQLEVAAQLVRMGDALVEQRQRRARPELEANLGGPEAVVVQAWAAQEDRRQEEMQQQLDALEDPETARAYLIDALLSLY